jgi:hypothetical protein
MKFVRTPIERKLLAILKELEHDFKIVKSKSDARSHRNKVILKAKIKIVQNALNKYRQLRRPTKSFVMNYNLPETKEVRSYMRKIDKLIRTFSIDDTKHYFIKMSKKDIKKGRLNVDTLKNIIKYLGDETWVEIDYPDTISQIKNGSSKGIAFTTYEDLDKKKLPNSNIYHSFSDASGEYTDVPSENVDFYKKNKDITTISLKKFLKQMS